MVGGFSGVRGCFNVWLLLVAITPFWIFLEIAMWSDVPSLRMPADSQGNGFWLSTSIREGIDTLPLQNIGRSKPGSSLWTDWKNQWKWCRVSYKCVLVELQAFCGCKVRSDSLCFVSFSSSSFASPPLGNPTFGKYMFTHCYIRDAVNWAQQCTAFCTYCLYSVFNITDTYVSVFHVVK